MTSRSPIERHRPRARAWSAPAPHRAAARPSPRGPSGCRPARSAPCAPGRRPASPGRPGCSSTSIRPARPAASYTVAEPSRASSAISSAGRSQLRHHLGQHPLEGLGVAHRPGRRRRAARDCRAARRAGRNRSAGTAGPCISAIAATLPPPTPSVMSTCTVGVKLHSSG